MTQWLRNHLPNHWDSNLNKPSQGRLACCFNWEKNVAFYVGILLVSIVVALCMLALLRMVSNWRSLGGKADLPYGGIIQQAPKATKVRMARPKQTHRTAKPWGW